MSGQNKSSPGVPKKMWGPPFYGLMVIILVVLNVDVSDSYAPVDIKLDEKAKQLHRIDSFNILAYTFLLILTVCTIWLFKRRRAKYIHETGLAILYGLIIGAIIKYVGEAESSFSHLTVVPAPDPSASIHSLKGPVSPHQLLSSLTTQATTGQTIIMTTDGPIHLDNGTEFHVNGSGVIATQPSTSASTSTTTISTTTTTTTTTTSSPTIITTSKSLEAPPDSVWVNLEIQDKLSKKHNKTYVYVFRGQLARDSAKGTADHDISQKATFDPEIFFNIILPPIIFNAGYSMKKKFFFRNIGAIMTYAFIGTTISCFGVGIILYGFVWLIPSLGFNFTDCLYFGAIISATDPVTILAIFSDLHVDVTLYALVFGESILNDAVAIVLAGSIDTYEQLKHAVQGEHSQMIAVGSAITNFLSMFVSSLFLGATIGCSTALLTKFTRLADFPILETCLFVLMSYSTFLMAEVLEFSGIVAVLFCGICQAHYTMNNLSEESKQRTKQLFELLNFVSENFIFTYIGVSMFTYPTHKWRFSFIIAAFIATFAGRALNVYPLSFLLNLGRHNKIPLNFQHVLFFSGLRGAMAFALALRNTLSEPRQLMLTTTSLIVILTVVVCGGSTNQLLLMLGIPIGIDESEHEMLNFTGVRRSRSSQTPTDLQSPSSLELGRGESESADGTPRRPGIQQQQQRSPYEKAWLVRKWYNFDVRFMKPLLTNSRPTLIDTLPDCCLPIARVLTTTEQLNDDSPGGPLNDGYDSDDGLVYGQSRSGSSGDRYNGTGHTSHTTVHKQQPRSSRGGDEWPSRTGSASAVNSTGAGAGMTSRSKRVGSASGFRSNHDEVIRSQGLDDTLVLISHEENEDEEDHQLYSAPPHLHLKMSSPVADDSSECAFVSSKRSSQNRQLTHNDHNRRRHNRSPKHEKF